MKAYNLIFFATLFSTMPIFACLRSKVDFDQEYFHCQIDQDCAIYPDSCRTCGDIWAVNAKMMEQLRTADYQFRKSDQCLRSCEACSTTKFKAVCVKSSCQSQEQKSF